MSFYIGFVTKDLVVLAADRQFTGYNDEPAGEAVKLKQINKNTWGVHIGAKFFGERWLWLLSHTRPKCLINTYSGLKLISPSIQRSYDYHLKKMKILNLELGFTNIAVAGFKKDKPFIYAMDSSQKFLPLFCAAGSIYNCIERDEKSIDSYIKAVTRALGGFQKESIDRQKTFLRTLVPKIFKYLSEKYDYISASGDMVFITTEVSVKESFNICQM